MPECWFSVHAVLSPVCSVSQGTIFSMSPCLCLSVRFCQRESCAKNWRQGDGGSSHSALWHFWPSPLVDPGSPRHALPSVGSAPTRLACCSSTFRWVTTSSLCPCSCRRDEPLVDLTIPICLFSLSALPLSCSWLAEFNSLFEAPGVTFFWSKPSLTHLLPCLDSLSFPHWVADGAPWCFNTEFILRMKSGT